MHGPPMPPTFPPSHGHGHGPPAAAQATTHRGRSASTGRKPDDMTRKVVSLVQLLGVKMRINYHGWLKWYLDIFGGISWYSYLLIWRKDLVHMFCIALKWRWINKWIQSECFGWFFAMNSVNHLFGCHDVSLAIWFARIDRLSHPSNIIEVFFRDVTATSPAPKWNQTPPNSPIGLIVRLHYVLQKMPKVNCKRWGKVPPRRSRWGGWNFSTAAEDGANGFTCGAGICLFRVSVINLSMGRQVPPENHVTKYIEIYVHIILQHYTCVFVSLYCFPSACKFQSKIQWFHDHPSHHHVGLEAKRQLAEAQEQMVSERQSKEALQALLACGRFGFGRTKGIGDDGMRTEIFCWRKSRKTLSTS